MTKPEKVSSTNPKVSSAHFRKACLTKHNQGKAREVCVRLFEYRREQAWPPAIAKGEGWDEPYTSQAKGLDVLPTADEAVEWANALVVMIDAAE